VTGNCSTRRGSASERFEVCAALLARVWRRELADDVLRMAGAIAWASTLGNTGQADRMLAVVLNGLR
jgi:hypothetical protein